MYEEYDKDGIVTKRGIYKNGSLDCFPVQQDKIQKNDEGNFFYEEHHKDGSLALKVPLNAGKKKDGVAELFFVGGKPAVRATYKNRSKDGGTTLGKPCRQFCCCESAATITQDSV
ncbi:hypothetical protein FACS1894214_4310 [Planctomycetales bacterium]|nr:hypothetical protein FACS1894214_4310 [Planctomycetales bacterium]